MSALAYSIVICLSNYVTFVPNFVSNKNHSHFDLLISLKKEKIKIVALEMNFLKIGNISIFLLSETL